MSITINKKKKLNFGVLHTKSDWLTNWLTTETEFSNESIVVPYKEIGDVKEPRMLTRMKKGI
jgi:hypothetical protein